MIKLLICLCIIGAVYAAPLAEYYCGFSTSYCGQSSSDDTNQNASLIYLAFANIAANGSVVVDAANYPCSLVQKWQGEGKKVMLSIGGQNVNWGPLFNNSQIGIASIVSILGNTTLDGIDLDIQSFTATPLSVGNFIVGLKQAIRGKYLSVCLQNVNVYQGQAVPSPTSSGIFWNYFVPIYNIAASSIDIVNVMAYNNWYDGLTQGSLAYLQDTYLNWVNLPSPFCDGCSVIANFTGVNTSKLVLGVPASPGGGQTSPTPAVIDQFQIWLQTNGYKMAGAFIWDSYWDAGNQYQISNAILTASTNTPLTPSTPTTPSNVCPAQTAKTQSQSVFKKFLVASKGHSNTKSQSNPARPQ